jgi:RHS repeat-associated protein
VTSAYQYDALNRLTNLVSRRLGNTIASYQYTVLPSGHRQTASEAVVTTSGTRGLGRSYGYDATYRLIVENLATAGITNLPASASVSYTLDDVGNRLARTSTLPGVNTTANGFDANDRLNTDFYDANGNTIGSTLGTDAYDFEDRLISRNNGQVVIVYDGDGNRVRKTVAGVTTLFLVDDQNPTGYAQVVEELTSTGGPAQVFRVYVYGNDLISQDQFDGASWTATFYGYDGHGSVRYLTDITGSVTDAYDYDAFGDLIAVEGNTPNLYLYTGEQFDEDLDLYYNRARYLDTDSGRFWTMDTFRGRLTDPVSLHKYVYASVDPVNGIDPTGLVDTRIDSQQAAQTVQVTLVRTIIRRTGKELRRVTKTITCVIGKEALQRGLAIEFHEHHPINRSLRGPDVTVPVPSDLHRAFHSILNVLLRSRQEFGGLGNWSSAEQWSRWTDSRAGRRMILTEIKAAARIIDRKCRFRRPNRLIDYIKENEAAWIRAASER